MSEKVEEAWGEIPTPDERDRIESLSYVIHYEGMGPMDHGHGQTADLRCYLVENVALADELFVRCPDAPLYAAVFVLAPLVGVRAALEIAPAFADEHLAGPVNNHLALSGIEVYRWLARVGICPTVPPSWGWESARAFAETVRNEILTEIHRSPRAVHAAQGDDDGNEIPF